MNKLYSIYITNQYISQSIFRVVSEGYRRTTRGAKRHQGVEDERRLSTVPGAAQEEDSMMHACSRALLLTIIADVYYI